MSVWLRYQERRAKSVKYRTQVIALLNSHSWEAVRRTVCVLRHRAGVKTHKITIKIDRISLPET